MLADGYRHVVAPGGPDRARSRPSALKSARRPDAKKPTPTTMVSSHTGSTPARRHRGGSFRRLVPPRMARSRSIRFRRECNVVNPEVRSSPGTRSIDQVPENSPGPSPRRPNLRPALRPRAGPRRPPSPTLRPGSRVRPHDLDLGRERKEVGIRHGLRRQRDRIERRVVSPAACRSRTPQGVQDVRRAPPRRGASSGVPLHRSMRGVIRHASASVEAHQRTGSHPDGAFPAQAVVVVEVSPQNEASSWQHAPSAQALIRASPLVDTDTGTWSRSRTRPIAMPYLLRDLADNIVTSWLSES